MGHRTLRQGVKGQSYGSDCRGRVGLSVEEGVPIPINFRGCALESAYRADLIVEKSVLLELKAVGAPVPIHNARIITYLKLLKLRVGLLLNFNVTHLGKGIRRFVR